MPVQSSRLIQISGALAQRVREAVQPLQRCGQMRKVDARKAGEMHGVRLPCRDGSVEQLPFFVRQIDNRRRYRIQTRA